MEPRSSTKASRAGETRLRRDLPEEILVWEILLRLPPKPLLRCRAVCRAWCCATSTPDFLLAHHRRQPCLPVVCGTEYGGARHKNIFAFDHKATGAQLQPVARLDDSCGAKIQSIFQLGDPFAVQASCDGLLIISMFGVLDTCFFACNPATRQHAPLPQLSGFKILGMYAHRPTGEYRLLLYPILRKMGWYVFALGSDRPPRYIGEGPRAANLRKPALVRDSLHWYPHQSDPLQYHQTGSKLLTAFDTTSESFRQMRGPAHPDNSYIFEMDGTLGIYSYDTLDHKTDIWMLLNYESEVWELKYNLKLPATEIRRRTGLLSDSWYVSVESVDGDVFLLVSHGGWMFHVDTDGKLVDSFSRDGQHVYASQLRLKQTLVPHTFFTALEGYAVKALPFV